MLGILGKMDHIFPFSFLEKVRGGGVRGGGG